MESSENNNSSTSKETVTLNDEDANMQPTTSSSSSTSPKRYKLDPNAPSTSSQSECNANHRSSTDEHHLTDDGGKSQQQTGDGDKKNKEVFGRFAKRNYRRRTESQSSTCSVPMEEDPTPEQNNDDNGTNSNQNNPEESPNIFPNFGADDLFMLGEDESTFSSEQDDSPEDEESSDSDDSENSTDNEQKTQAVLNKPKPECDLDLVRNVIFRQSGIFYKNCYSSNMMRTNVAHTGLTQSIKSSIYTVERMQLLHTLERHYGCVNCLNFNKAGNLLVTGSDDLRVIVWNWAKRQPLIVQKSGHRSNVFQSKFVDNGSATNQTDFHLITSARDGEVRQIHVAPDGSAKERLITRHPNHPVHKIAIPDSNPNEVLTAGEDGCVVRSDLRDHKSNERLVQLKVNGDEIPLYSVAHHPFDPEFCICGRDKYVRVYDKRNAKECSKMFCPENIRKQTKCIYINITCALYNYNGSEILASYGDENIYLFDTADNSPGAYKKTYYGHKNRQTIKGVNFFGPNSEFIMSGSDCGNFFIWDKNSEAIVQWLPGDETGVVNCLEAHPHFPIIATSGLDHDVKIWSPTNPNGRPSEVELKKCIKENLKHQTDLMRTYMRNIARLVNGNFHRAERSSSDSSDSDDDDEDLRTFYRPDRGPCEVQ